MFRGDARHSGVFETTGVEARPGVLWRFNTRGAVRSSPVVSEGRVYVGSTDGGLYALDAETGTLEWQADVGSPVSSSAAVAGGLVLFTSRDGVLHARDADTGAPRWRVASGPEAPWEWGYEGWDVYVASPVIHEDRVLMGGIDGVVYALDLTTGAELWRFTTGGRIRSTPAVADGSVFVGSSDGAVYALDLADGSQRWRHETDGFAMVSADMGVDRKSIIASPLVAEESVYVGSRDGYMYALDQATGRRRWQVSHEGSWAISSPAEAPGALIAGTSDGSFVHRVDAATGEEVWRFQGAGYTWSSPALAGETVYIGDGAGYLWALDAASGLERWSFPVGSGVYSSPWVEDGVVFFGADDGVVYALGGGAPPVYRAVFWDEALVPAAFAPHLEPRVFFEMRGYEVVDSDALAGFLEARISDGARSVVVFALDRLPETVAAEAADSVLFRRYLDAGGKALWMGLPPQSLARNDQGQVYFEREGPQRLLGVDYTEANFDYYGAAPTALGRTWGLEGGWVGNQAVSPDQDILVLGLDENGRAAAWVKTYGGPEGTGFVGMGLQEVTPASLSAAYSAAEYGLEARHP
jgi:outer membrane protein assembly factor BamB